MGVWGFVTSVVNIVAAVFTCRKNMSGDPVTGRVIANRVFRYGLDEKRRGIAGRILFMARSFVSSSTWV